MKRLITEIPTPNLTPEKSCQHYRKGICMHCDQLSFSYPAELRCTGQWKGDIWRLCGYSYSTGRTLMWWMSTAGISCTELVSKDTYRY